MRNVLILTLAAATSAAIIGYSPPADPVPPPRPRPDFEHAFSAGQSLPAWANGSFGYYGPLPLFAAPVVAKGQ